MKYYQITIVGKPSQEWSTEMTGKTEANKTLKELKKNNPSLRFMMKEVKMKKFNP